MSTPTPKPNRRVLGSLAGNYNTTNLALDVDESSRDLARKASLNALLGNAVQSSGATSPRRQSQRGHAAMDQEQREDLEVGDLVGVPGGMTGTVRFIGAVEGKNGVFAGVELSQEYASRGKNDGDVDGVRYFTTSKPGAGIFLPSHRAIKQSSPALTASTFPPTPTTPAFKGSDAGRPRQSSARTPPTPSMAKFSQSVGPGVRHPFSQSVGPGARAPSPQMKLKAKPRPSLPRPESPLRKQANLQPTPRGPSRTMRPSGISPANTRLSKPATPAAPRSPSRSQSSQGYNDFSPDRDSTPTSMIRPKMSLRNLSDKRSLGGSDELQRLQRELDERDRQLKEQASALAEMEGNLAEVQSLVAASTSQKQSWNSAPEPGTEDADSTQLRSILRTKQERIEYMQKEFDSHRADFRSTIDALEMAATETERIYERQKQELSKENDELKRSQEDVATITQQFKDFEDLVQDLEENVELARRGEAEAKAEAEFLHGEVERLRLELRREREKAAKAVQGANAAVGENGAASPAAGDSRELERRDDEIRGLKAIIHSLSSGPEANSPARNEKANGIEPETASRLQEQIAALQRDKSELQGLVDRKKFHEEDLERENARLRAAAGSNPFVQHEKTDSSSTATMHTAHRDSTTSVATAVRPSTGDSYSSAPQKFEPASSRPGSSRVQEKDAESGTEGSVSAAGDGLWCELCESSGHDILTCSSMFKDAASSPKQTEQEEDEDVTMTPKVSNESKVETTNGAKSARSSTDKTLVEPNARPALPVGDGPAPGKESGVINKEQWCAMCERDGHLSFDCPYEDY